MKYQKLKIGENFRYSLFIKVIYLCKFKYGYDKFM